ncbi:MAG: biotin/lipoate A/B protein ligase family protein, partial [Candidatus Nanohaloarchaea archaeon]
IPIGRFQSYQDEVEHDFVAENDIEVVRRITGGGAMFSEPGKVITYSIYIPKDQVTEDIEESYKELDEFAVKTLKTLGVEANYAPLNDIEHSEGKLGGAAQTRKQNAVLHHTMMSYDLDTRKMLKALRIGKEKVSDKAIESAEKRVSRISDHIDYSREEVIEALIENFVENKKYEYGCLTEEEIEKAEKLADEKFRTEEWNQKL